MVGPDWQIAEATGDYNGDGRSDILWRNDNGLVAVWEMDGASATFGVAGVLGADWLLV